MFNVWVKVEFLLPNVPDQTTQCVNMGQPTWLNQAVVA